MEQFLKNFFNDNSVCVGLCDLKRKNDEISFNFTQPIETKAEKPLNQFMQKTPKMTLAQKFAAQQQAYAAQQAQIAEQRKLYAEQLAKQKAYMQQQQANQKAQFAQHAYAVQQEMQQIQEHIIQHKPVSKNFNNSYRTSSQQSSQAKVIINGNMKKVVSPAIPARY